MRSARLLLIAISAAFVAGIVVTSIWSGHWPSFITSIRLSQDLYLSSDATVIEQFNSEQPQHVTWGALLTDEDRQAITHFSSEKENQITAQIYQSLEAAFDTTYRETMQSNDVVDALIGQPINISGFIVPLELLPSRRVESFFLVPYFGACIHFPPPPPNQMIYVRVSEGIENIDTSQPVTVSGWIEQIMYEDPMGTSAYGLRLVQMTEYNEAEHPDDVRNH